MARASARNGSGGLVGTAAGDHERKTYVQLMVALRSIKASGILRIDFRRRSRTLFLLGGELAAYRSDLPEETIEKTLVTGNLVPADRLKWMMDRLAPGENLADALVMSGAISQEALTKHIDQRKEQGTGSVLSWSQGKWSFESRPGLLASQIDPELIARSDVLPSLWQGVKQFVAMEEILSQVSDPSFGKMQAGDGLTETLKALESNDPPKLAEALKDSCSMDELFTRIPDTTGTLVKLVWFLSQTDHIRWEAKEAGQAVKVLRSAETAPPVVESAAPQASRKPAGDERKAKRTRSSTQSGNRPTRDISKVINNDYRRMDRDFYAFLGLPNTASDDQIRMQCKRVAKRWRTAQNNPDLSASGQDQVKDLLAGASLVWQMLKEPKNRTQYDERMKTGRAPTVRGALPVTIADRHLGAPLEVPEEEQWSNESVVDNQQSAESNRARDLVDNEQFTAAIPLLQRARMENPSDADTLADLGWSIFKAIGSGHPDDDDTPEDFVRLALTFDPNNVRGLEYWARMAIEGGEVDEARRRIKNLVKQHPNHTWGRSLSDNDAALEKEVHTAIRQRRGR